MKKNKEAIPDDEALLETPTVEVDGKEFRPFESDGEFWAMLDAIENSCIKECGDPDAMAPAAPRPPKEDDTSKII